MIRCDNKTFHLTLIQLVGSPKTSLLSRLFILRHEIRYVFVSDEKSPDAFTSKRAGRVSRKGEMIPANCSLRL